MRKNFMLLPAAMSIIALLHVQEGSAQNTTPYWSLAGNSNATINSKLGTTNAVPVRMFTSNLERLRITPAGNVGIGTVNPTTKLEVSRSDGHYLLAKFTNLSSAGDRTALVDIQNGQGVIWRYGVGGAGNGYGINAGQFYIERGYSGVKMIIDAEGDVGIGTPAPGSGLYRLRVRHENYALDLQNSTTSNHWEIWTDNNSAANLSLYYNGSFKGSFNPGNGAYTSVSDERLKSNIMEMPAVLEKVGQLKPATYRFNKDNPAQANSAESYGFLAQDVKKIFPHLVSSNVDKESGLDTYTMDYSGFGVIAIKAIQELQKPMQEQAQKIDKQQQQINELQKQVEEMKALVSKLASGGTTNGFLSGAALGLVSPNPVTGSARISYILPEAANRAQLVIADALGGISKTIELNSSGVIRLETSALNSGVYTYSLVVDNKTVQTRKMTIVK